jgi:hypothetical protein
MGRTGRAVALVVAAVAFSGVLAGCGSDATVDEAETDYCSATDEVEDAFGDFAGMNPDETSSNDVRDARDRLADAVAHLEDAATDVADARNDVENDPITRYNERIQDIGPDASMTEAAAEMTRATFGLLADTKDYIGDLDCDER